MPRGCPSPVYGRTSCDSLADMGRAKGGELSFRQQQQQQQQQQHIKQAWKQARQTRCSQSIRGVPRKWQASASKLLSVSCPIGVSGLQAKNARNDAVIGSVQQKQDSRAKGKVKFTKLASSHSETRCQQCLRLSQAPRPRNPRRPSALPAARDACARHLVRLHINI